MNDDIEIVILDLKHNYIETLVMTALRTINEYNLSRKNIRDMLLRHTTKTLLYYLEVKGKYTEKLREAYLEICKQKIAKIQEDIDYFEKYKRS